MLTALFRRCLLLVRRLSMTFYCSFYDTITENKTHYYGRKNIYDDLFISSTDKFFYFPCSRLLNSTHCAIICLDINGKDDYRNRKKAQMKNAKTNFKLMSSQKVNTRNSTSNDQIWQTIKYIVGFNQQLHISLTLLINNQRIFTRDLWHLFKSSRPEVFCKKGVLRNFTKFTGKHLCQSL